MEIASGQNGSLRQIAVFEELGDLPAMVRSTDGSEQPESGALRLGGCRLSMDRGTDCQSVLRRRSASNLRRGRAARVAPGEDATAEKRPFERPIAVHAAAAEAGRLAHRV